MPDAVKDGMKGIDDAAGRTSGLGRRRRLPARRHGTCAEADQFRSRPCATRESCQVAAGLGQTGVMTAGSRHGRSTLGNKVSWKKNKRRGRTAILLP